MELRINGKLLSFAADADMPLLWVIRETAGLTGTKFGCGAGLCGACTVYVDSQPRRSCVTPVSSVTGKSITTIEGLSPDTNHAIQKAWIQRRAAVRLLPVGNDHGRRSAAQAPSGADRHADRRSDEQPVSLRHLPPCSRRHPHGRERLRIGVEDEATTS